MLATATLLCSCLLHGGFALHAPPTRPDRQALQTRPRKRGQPDFNDGIVKIAYGADRRHCSRRPKSRIRTDQVHRIIGGEAAAKPYPFMAWIGDQDGSGMMHFCGGTLISERLVLTAAHCLYASDRKNSRIYVRLNLLDYKEEPGIARSVVQWRRHEKYNRFTMFNDVALLLLNESVPASEITPVRLTNGTEDTHFRNSTMNVIGWGSRDENCMHFDNFLRQAAVPVGKDNSTCFTPGSSVITPTMDFNSTSQLCAGNYTGDPLYPGCGDSGGPLLVNVSGNWTQVGLVSWTYGFPFPDIFTRVSSYNQWIDETSAEMLQKQLDTTGNGTGNGSLPLHSW